MLVHNELDWVLETFGCTVIRVTEKAIKLPFIHNFLALSLDHYTFDALATGNFTTTHQINRFSVLKIEGKFAE
jgi:hypothetical protein